MLVRGHALPARPGQREGGGEGFASRESIVLWAAVRAMRPCHVSPLAAAAAACCLSYWYCCPRLSPRCWLVLRPTSILLSSVAGLFFEAVVEASYPLGEVSINSLMTLINNVACGVFLLITPLFSPQTMNWVMTGGTFLCGASLLLFQVSFWWSQGRGSVARAGMCHPVQCVPVRRGVPP